MKGLMDEIKKMSVKEFREEGYLQELNRCFLHPLGLALEVITHEDGTESFGRVWDYRDDPEGVIFGPGVIKQKHIDRIYREMEAKREIRVDLLGSDLQIF